MANSSTGDGPLIPGRVYRMETKRKALLRNAALAVLFICVLFAAVPVINALTSPGDFYLFPRDAVDWTAWLTGLGAIGTTVALFYAALQFQRDAAEQREARINRDLQARQLAEVVMLDVGGIFPKNDDTWDVCSGFWLQMTNTGHDVIRDIQIKIPDVAKEIDKAQVAPIPPYRVEEDPGFGRDDEQFTLLENPTRPTCAQNIWLCGDLEPRSILRLNVRFTDLQPSDHWQESAPGSGIEGRVAVIFTDRDGHTWIRSSEGRQPLQRLWPESFVTEDRPQVRPPHCAAPKPTLATEGVPSGGSVTK